MSLLLHCPHRVSLVFVNACWFAGHTSTTSSTLEPILTINGVMHRKDLDILNRGYHTGDFGLLEQEGGTCNHGMLNLKGDICDHGMRFVRDDTCDHGNMSKDEKGGDDSVR